MRGGFGELELLFLVGWVCSLEDHLISEVDGVVTEDGLAACDVVWVLFEKIKFFLDPPGLGVVKVPFVLGIIFLVPLEHQIDFFTLLDILHELCQLVSKLRLNL